MITLQQKFKSLRQNHHFTQKHVAGILGLSIPAYSKLEAGATDPNFTRLGQIAAFYKMTIQELLDLEDHVNQAVKPGEISKIKIAELESDMISLQGKLIAAYEREAVLLKKIKRG